mmetsp:Transcript_5463/g.18080  ORF Transcript_5463/g.18080 Transcript_5463/m.18080 type:complete len:215 (-) Transcript_5463:383-1027(-)
MLTHRAHLSCHALRRRGVHRVRYRRVGGVRQRKRVFGEAGRANFSSPVFVTRLPILQLTKTRREPAVDISQSARRAVLRLCSTVFHRSSASLSAILSSHRSAVRTVHVAIASSIRVCSTKKDITRLRRGIRPIPAQRRRGFKLEFLEKVPVKPLGLQVVPPGHDVALVVLRVHDLLQSICSASPSPVAPPRVRQRPPGNQTPLRDAPGPVPQRC